MSAAVGRDAENCNFRALTRFPGRSAESWSTDARGGRAGR